ncbi:MAG: bifunctional 3-deoxy-7-phosphoheptulonate synthase/chorismate mutase type II [Chlorobi bacterium]|nr:bifunctional 3-deoxy-7-phosphoheptulonate synthase/chorismate mutase type II [Chlorobiota bacterium]
MDGTPAYRRWLDDMQLGHPLTIAGPCSAESREQVLETARRLTGGRVTVFRAGVWKPRTKPGNFEGVGEIALPWLQEVKKETGLEPLIEVATPYHVEAALRHGIRMMWIGARTTANPFAVQEVAEALRGNSDVIVLVKNPVNPDTALWIGAVERLMRAGLTNLGAVHRGFSVYNPGPYRNKPKWQIPLQFKRHFPGMPMIIDPSHICGRRDCLFDIAQMALDLQYDGVMIESHRDPDRAWSDAAQQVTPETLHDIIRRLMVRKTNAQEGRARDKLLEYRRHIDIIDEQLLELLAERMKVVREIGRLKRSHNISLLQPQRWNEVFERAVRFAARHGLNEDFIKAVFTAIHEESLWQQKNGKKPED